MAVHLHGLEEGPHAGTVVVRLAQLLCLVVQRVELSRAESVTDLAEKGADSVTVAQLLEIHLGDADLCRSCRVHQVNGLGLVTVVLEVSDRSPLLEGDVGADGRAPERSSSVLGAADFVRAVLLGGAAKVIVRSQLNVARLACDAFACVPGSEVILVPVGEVGIAGSLALTKVLYLAEMVA